MTDAGKLALLKQDLQLLTTANDTFLTALIQAAESAMESEGIILSPSTDLIDTAVVEYAAYLFRRRASENTAMPRFLRYQLNQILFSQKVNAGGEA